MEKNKLFMAMLAIVFAFTACRKENSPIGNKPDGAHVQWDIISTDIPITTINPGGIAYASAITGDIPSGLKIKFKGAGTFVAYKDGKPSDAVTGGGEWETFLSNKSTGSGTYKVKKLANWEFANFWVGGPPNDNIGKPTERANGTAVLLIDYSDGSQGTLGIGCHGPGSPDGILEGIIATKGYVEYWTAELTMATENKNRTLFHVFQENNK